MPTRIIIDTDPGIDDAIAIALAVASPELELVGVTTVGGNTGIENTTGNALRLLHLLGRDDIPVGAGAARAIAFDQDLGDPSIHGQHGLGGVVLADPGRGPDPRGALGLLVDLIEGSDVPITLIAIGPLTNVALLAATRPEVYGKLERLVIMGGGVRITGNHTPTGEFNIWFDPEAAARVFQAGIPVTMVGLDVTHKAMFAGSDWAPLRADDAGPIARAIVGMVDFYGTYYLSQNGSDATAQHDSLAVAAVVRPELLTTKHCWVGVECAGTLTRGMTVADLKNVWGHEPNAHVALDVDVPGFIELLVGRIADLDARAR
jgi:pyrimidine-specific ribonucleoside hydrolase